MQAAAARKELPACSGWRPCRRRQQQRCVGPRAERHEAAVGVARAPDLHSFSHHPLGSAQGFDHPKTCRLSRLEGAVFLQVGFPAGHHRVAASAGAVRAAAAACMGRCWRCRAFCNPAAAQTAVTAAQQGSTATDSVRSAWRDAPGWTGIKPRASTSMHACLFPPRHYLPLQQPRRTEPRSSRSSLCRKPGGWACARMSSHAPLGRKPICCLLPQLGVAVALRHVCCGCGLGGVGCRKGPALGPTAGLALGSKAASHRATIAHTSKGSAAGGRGTRVGRPAPRPRVPPAPPSLRAYRTQRPRHGGQMFAEASAPLMPSLPTKARSHPSSPPRRPRPLFPFRCAPPSCSPSPSRWPAPLQLAGPAPTPASSFHAWTQTPTTCR